MNVAKEMDVNNIPLVSIERNSSTARTTENWAMVLYVLSGLGGALLSTFGSDWWGSFEQRWGVNSGPKVPQNPENDTGQTQHTDYVHPFLVPACTCGFVQVS